MTYTINGNISAGSVVTERVPYPIRNLSSITSVTTPNADVEIRIARNSVDFGEWINASSINESIDQNNDPVIEIRVTPTSNITDPEFTISGTPSPTPYEFVDISETAYSDIDPKSIRFEKLWLNLFYKLHGEGIVPSFVDRDSSDAISYFKYLAISHALNIELAEIYLYGFKTNQTRLLAYLEQKSLLICPQTPLSDLQAIITDTIEILRDRGTYGIDKELRRWLCIDECTPFFLENAPRHLSGWTVDRSSPNYTGKEHYQLNAAPTKGEGIYASDGLIESGNVNYITGDGSGFFLLEDGDELLLESTDINIADIDGDNLIVHYDIIRDVVCLGDAPLPKDFLVQEGGTDKIQQENRSGILIERQGSLAGSEPYVEFEVCVNTSFDYELRFWAKTDLGSGIRVDINADSQALYSNAAIDNFGGLPLPLSSFVAVPSTELQRANDWIEFRVPIAPHPAPVINNAYEPNYQAEVRRHMPQGSYDQFWMDGLNPRIVRLTIRITNPFSENLYLHKLSIGPTSIDNIGVRLDAYNESTLIYQDKVGIEQIEDIYLKTRKYLIPYGGTLYVEKIKRTS